MAELNSALARRIEGLRKEAGNRDNRMKQVAAVRRGEADSIFPGLFNEDWPKPIIANFIDIAARDLAEMLAPLPSINCSASDMTDDTARKKADKRTRIVNHYTVHSNLVSQMYTAADFYFSYGFTPFLVEPDFEAKTPRVTVVDPMGAYPSFDAWGRCTGLAKVFRKSIRELCDMFPDLAGAIAKDLDETPNWQERNSSSELDLIIWYDKDQMVTYLPERRNLVLRSVRNPLGKCPIVVARRPTLDGNLRGQFDDVLWVQLARAKFALLSLEAVQKAVQAPLVVPPDANEIPLGPDAVIQTQQGVNSVGRVKLDLPTGAFAESQMLDQESRIGARYPQARTGNMDASVITGRGVQALMGGFDAQIKAGQDILAEVFRQVFGLCLELDEKFWPEESRTVRGVHNGTPYELTYRPSRDIKGAYMVDVAYGLLAGLDPNRALVWGLQARGDKLISRNRLRNNLPIEGMDPTMEEQVIDIEEMRDALKQALAGDVQAIPALAAQGIDPAVKIRQVTKAIKARRKGESIEDAIAYAYAPEPSPEASPGTEQPSVPGAPGSEGASGELPPGLGPDGLMRGVMPGQQGMAPGGRPDLQMLLAGLSANGQPNLQANVSRRQAI